jgi:hypothetical protein
MWRAENPLGTWPFTLAACSWSRETTSTFPFPQAIAKALKPRYEEQPPQSQSVIHVSAFLEESGHDVDVTLPRRSHQRRAPLVLHQVY